MALSLELEEMRRQETSLKSRIKQLKSDIEDLSAKKAALSESLKEDAFHFRALFAQAKAEGKQAISSVVQVAQQVTQMAKELFDEWNKVSYETIATISKLNLEVSKQFESISRLEGFKDLAEVISIVSAIDTNEKLGASSRELLPKLDLHTIGILSMLISAYEKYGPEAKVITEPFSHVRALLATFVATSHIGTDTQQQAQQSQPPWQTRGSK